MEHSEQEDRYPELLYKYRDYNNSFHRDLLYKQELYFSNINSLNDIFEGSLSVNKLLEKANTYNNLLFQEEMRSLIYKAKEELIKVNRTQISRNGIVSLSKSPSIPNMWTYYAAGYEGFCIGFDMLEIKKYINANVFLEEVIYTDTMPEFNLTESNLELYHKILCTKNNRYEYEEEKRLISIDLSNYSIKIGLETFHSIYLGNKMNLEVRDSIISYLRLNAPQCKIYDICTDYNGYDLKQKLVDL